MGTDERGDGAELVERAPQLVAIANDVLELAVASARERDTSWEDIGEVLPGPEGGGVCRARRPPSALARAWSSCASTRYSRARAAPMAGQLGWTAGPDGVDRPDETVGRLDAWALRHRERTDPSLRGRSDDELVSAALRARYRPALDSIGPITLLAQLLADAIGPFANRPLPPGVTERYARQRLLEFKLAAADAMLDERRRRGGADVVLDRDAIFDELADILAETCRDQLRFDWHDDGQTATVRLHDKALLIVERSDDDRAPDTAGWWLWGIGPDGRSDPGPEWPQPLAATTTCRGSPLDAPNCNEPSKATSRAELLRVDRAEYEKHEEEDPEKRRYRAYLLKEQLRQIYRRDLDEAINVLDAWLQGASRCRLQPFVKLARTIRDKRAGIEAAIRNGLSNARVEQVNTQIRLITRRGFGYHSQEAVIALALLKLGGLCPPLPGR